MTQVILVPRNPLDLRPEDLEPLVEQIKLRNDLTVDVRVVPQRGYGVTWWEVLEIVVIYVGLKTLDTAVGHPIQLLLDKITEDVKHWYLERRAKRSKPGRTDKRPLSLTFRDEEGQVLQAVEMHPPEEDMADKKPSKSRKPRPKKAEKPLKPRPSPKAISRAPKKPPQSS